jgi:hypothetical protein
LKPEGERVILETGGRRNGRQKEMALRELGATKQAGFSSIDQGGREATRTYLFHSMSSKLLLESHMTNKPLLDIPFGPFWRIAFQIRQ